MAKNLEKQHVAMSKVWTWTWFKICGRILGEEFRNKIIQTSTTCYNVTKKVGQN